MLRKFRCADFGPNLQGGELPPLRGSAWGTSPFPPPQLYAYVYGYGWAMDVYCVHWVQNAQIRPVRFFSNFKSCGNFAVPTLDQIFRGGNFPPLRGSGGGTSPFSPPSCTPMLVEVAEGVLETSDHLGTNPDRFLFKNRFKCSFL